MILSEPIQVPIKESIKNMSLYPCATDISWKQGEEKKIKCKHIEKLNKKLKELTSNKKIAQNLTLSHDILETIYNFKKKLYSSLNISQKFTPCIGKKGAKYTFYVFTDFECSACQAFRFKMYELIREYPIRICIKQFPVSIVHSYPLLSLAVIAAYLQARFFPFYEQCFRHIDDINTMDALLKLAAKNNIDIDKLKKDIYSDTVKNILIRHTLEGGSIGIDRTPTLVYQGELFTNFELVDDWIYKKINQN